MSIDAKLDTVIEATTEIKITLGKQQVILDEHIRRTELLEKEIKPLQKQHTILNFVAKVLSLIIGSGIFIAIMEKLLHA